MAVISITITESPIFKIAGIPLTVTLTPNIPSTVFYTIDGSIPTTSSSIAIGPIYLPTDENVVYLKIYATNGTDNSPIITQRYGADIIGTQRFHASVTGLDNSQVYTHFPFATPQPNPEIIGKFGVAGGVWVDNPLQPQSPDGYDGFGTGTPATFYNPPLERLDFIYSETDSIGQMGVGIGTLPAKATVIRPTNDNAKEAQEESNTNSPFFNPKALVIFQDSSEVPFDENVTTTMRPYFDLEPPGKARDGALFAPNESIAPMGSFVKSHYNPRTNQINYYYYDNRVNRWIISSETYVPKDPNMGNLGNIIFSSSKPASRFIFKWIPFRYRTLF